MEDEEWDIITIQQASTYSGQASTYTRLVEIVSYLNQNEPGADVYWHLTWAYQQDSTHNAFPNYGRDQMTMYHAIVGAYQASVATCRQIVGMIPSGTAVQNLRTSYVGDTVTRDGHHMSYTHGRYLTALTWYAYLTGGSVDLVDWVPQNYPALAYDLNAMREAVDNAIAIPTNVTPSQFTEAAPAKGDADYFESLGLNIEDYELIEWDPMLWSFYNSTGGMMLHDSTNDSASLCQKYIASVILSREDLPEGAVIIVDNGYQYRPEGWKDENDRNSSATRPGNDATPAVVVDEEWWGEYQYRAFNLSKISGGKMQESDAVHLRIYVPITEGEE